ncbi:MAG: LysR family transcriptional regulator [Cyclobacteriaceae bacterium]
MKLIKSVAEEGTLTKATNKLFLSQSSLSHQLKEIETQLNTPVFLRVNRKLVLTDAGKILYNTANKVLEELDHFNREITRAVHGEYGKIRLCTECYTCYHWLPPIIKNYSYDHPNIDVLINTDNVANPLSQIIDGKLDLAIIHRKIDSKQIQYLEIFDDELVLVVSKNHSLNNKKYIYASDFKDQVFVTHSKNYKKSSIFERVLIPENVTPKRVVYMQITEAAIEMVKAGLGVAVMAKWAMKPYIESRKVNVIPITRKGLWRKWYIATLRNPNDQKPEYLNDFIDQILNANQY